jgi:hypothetical protein
MKMTTVGHSPRPYFNPEIAGILRHFRCAILLNADNHNNMTTKLHRRPSPHYLENRAASQCRIESNAMAPQPQATKLNSASQVPFIHH